MTLILITLGATLLPACRPTAPVANRATTVPAIRPPEPPSPPAAAPTSAPIADPAESRDAAARRARVETVFESAAYYRPNLDSPNPNPASTTPDSPRKTHDSPLSRALPPLFAIRIPPGESRLPDHARIGRITVDDKGHVSLDPARPAVYWAEDTVLIHHRPHRQLWYVWFLAARAPEQTASDPAEVVARRERHRLIITSARQPPLDAPLRHWQALRMTLSDDGFAICTEVFQSEQIAKEYYIAESLETAAAAFGLPGPGQTHSVERPALTAYAAGTTQPADRIHSKIQNPKSKIAAVARLLADGPQPMGPWVYLDAADHAVTTLLCRCMPSQIKSIVENNTYDLLPLSSLAALPAADPLPAAPLSLLGRDRLDAQPDALTHDLRLPPILP